MILEEGLENVWKRHSDVAAYVRNKVTSLVLNYFPRHRQMDLPASGCPKA